MFNPHLKHLTQSDLEVGVVLDTSTHLKQDLSAKLIVDGAAGEDHPRSVLSLSDPVT
jgi:hypothetical protein